MQPHELSHDGDSRAGRSYPSSADSEDAGLCGPNVRIFSDALVFFFELRLTTLLLEFRDGRILYLDLRGRVLAACLRLSRTPRQSGKQCV